MLDKITNALDNWYVMAGLGLALVGLIILMIKVRNKREED